MEKTTLLLLLALVSTSVTEAKGGCSGKKDVQNASPELPRVLDFPGTVLRIDDPEGEVTDLVCARGLEPTANAYWQGVCQDGGEANFLQLSSTDGSALSFGSFHNQGKVCTILPDAVGETTFRCVDESELGSEDGPDDDDYPDFLDDEDELVEHENGGRRLFAMDHSISSLSHRRLYDDSGSTIDVMVVWTKKAECLNSGLPEGCTFTTQTNTNMLGLAFLAVSETNAAFALSNVNTRLRLVHAYRTPDYEEPSDDLAYRTILRDLARRSDLEMTDVHVQRDLYGADIVHMIVGAPGACGRAYLGPNIRSAFSISNYECSTGYYSFGHEIAHSFGANHDRASLGIPEGYMFGYNFGYKDPNEEYRTIMSYPCDFAQTDNVEQSRTSCPRLQRFSNNATLTEDGSKLGDEYHDVARTINEASAEIASYYPAMDCIDNEQCDDQRDTTIDLCDPIRRVCIFIEDLSESDPSMTVAEPGCYTSYLQSYYLAFWNIMDGLLHMFH